MSTIIEQVSGELAAVHDKLGRATTSLFRFIQGAERTAQRFATGGLMGKVQRVMAVANQGKEAHQGIALADGAATKARDAASVAGGGDEVLSLLHVSKEAIGDMRGAAAQAEQQVDRLSAAWSDAMRESNAGPGLASMSTVKEALEETVGRAGAAEDRVGELIALVSGAGDDF
ncbi:MAG: hypothetical protein ACRDT6_20820 [Micromonosporaceae bacterium]